MPPKRISVIHTPQKVYKLIDSYSLRTERMTNRWRYGDEGKPGVIPTTNKEITKGVSKQILDLKKIIDAGFKVMGNKKIPLPEKQRIHNQIILIKRFVDTLEKIREHPPSR